MLQAKKEAGGQQSYLAASDDEAVPELCLPLTQGRRAGRYVNVPSSTWVCAGGRTYPTLGCVLRSSDS